MIGEVVTILRPGTPTRDSHGNDVPGPDIEIDVDHCAVWQTGTSEQVQDQDQVQNSIQVFFPFGTSILATDRLRVRSEVFQVVGRPPSWSSPFTGTRAGVEVQAERVTG
ncbi:MAG TPA: hypothetical protein VIR33_12470 [Thermopolyspora sp.]|jgi:hypothetical protein